MSELDGKTLDIEKQNIEKLKELFPEINSDGKIDFGQLKEILGEYVDDSEERYKFTWNGKGEALRLSQTPSMGTLRPDRETSKEWDATGNLYIEGDNLEVLKLLQKSYFGKIKMIYIDPPYNTGKDFVYPDNYKDNITNYKKITGQVDGEGRPTSTNAEYSGRYHTDWLNMMYPRLKLARNLLTNDGVIFISIDDNEVHNLRKICDEIFGENNFVASLVWEKKKKGAFLNDFFINMKEYILVYIKDNKRFNGLVGEINEAAETYPCIKTTNARGIRTIRKGTVSNYREKNFKIEANKRISSGNMELIYLDETIIKDGVLMNDVRIDSNWIYAQKTLDEYNEKNSIYITQDLYIRRNVNDARVKMLKDLLLRVGVDGNAENEYKHNINLNCGGWGTNEDANDELHKSLGIQNIFEFSKPTKLLAKLIQSLNDKEAVILDFFSGSSSTADAIMRINSADNGNRKYIMVQLPELTDRKSEAYKANYKTISQIGKERIRLAGENIKEEIEVKYERCSEEERKNMKKPGELDKGFKVFKLDSTNIKQWNPSKYDNIQLAIQSSLNPYVEGRTEEDVVYEMILKMGLDLTYPIDEYQINGKKIYSIGYGLLMICLSEDIELSVAEKMVAIKDENNQKEFRVIFRDAGFNSDKDKTNVKETLKVAGLEQESFITL